MTSKLAGKAEEIKYKWSQKLIRFQSKFKLSVPKPNTLVFPDLFRHPTGNRSDLRQFDCSAEPKTEPKRKPKVLPNYFRNSIENRIT